MPADRTQVPTPYIWGDQDLAVRRTAAEGTGKWVDAPYRSEDLPGAGHWLPDANRPTSRRCPCPT
ncbi:hypothetical protein [Streptomyces vinaceus]|uniref:hypothetical protein n=1 Tax=Streptomyces vinaceus TaxID=1960 RepID=UPI0036B08DFF